MPYTLADNEAMAMQLAAVALNVLMHLPAMKPGAKMPRAVRPAMFAAAAYDGEESYQHIAEQVASDGQDIVLLEFDAASHLVMPATITVFQLVDDAVEIYRGCKLWTSDDQSMHLLIPAGQDAGWVFDGFGLIGIDIGHNDLDAGFEVGEVLHFRGIMLLQDDPTVKIRTLSRKLVKRKKRH